MALTPVFIDLETFWSTEHTLTKMSPIAYCTHPETEVISIAAKVGSFPTDVLFGEDKIKQTLSKIDWSDKFVIGHNMSGFDAMILAWRFGIKPAMWGCTLAMARPIYTKQGGVSLKNVAQRLEVGVKDSTALVNTKGKHLKDFTQAELDAMAEYNREDTEMCAAIFKKLLKTTSSDELRLIDLTIRMLVEPQFELDAELLKAALEREQSSKADTLRVLGDMLHVDDTGLELTDRDELVRMMLASSAKFATFLREQGVEPPMKTSKTTGKPTLALAKTDEAFLALQEHENELVAAATRARLGVKSTLLETRIGAFLAAGEAAGGKLPVPLNYYGADTTGRWSGWAYNCQNLPRISGKNSDALRLSMRAPPGHKIVVADLSGIELRVNMFLWRVPYAMDLFQRSPDKADLYRYFAANELYMVPEDEITKAQRQLGKVCVVEGTLVLTERGEIPIEQVVSSDRVWDGVEWVNTLGPVYNGEHYVIEHDGITATPDHEVWVEDGRKIQIQEAATQLLRLARTGDRGAPLGFSGAGIEGCASKTGVQGGVSPLYGLRHDEVRELRQLAEREDTGVSVVSSEVWRTEVASTADGVSTTTVHEPKGRSVQELWGARHQLPLSISESSGGLGGGEPGSAKELGVRPDRHERALRTWEPAVYDKQSEHGYAEELTRDPVSCIQARTPGRSLCGHHTEENDLPRDDGQADSGAVARPIMQTKRRVWDLLNCGPRHRFTANGRLVSNCHLGLGFGSGASTFQQVAKTLGGVDMDIDEATTAVRTYREAHPEIVQGWKTCHAGLDVIYRGGETVLDPWGMCVTTPEGIRTPRGMIRYPMLAKERNDQGKVEWMYGEGRRRTRIYAGKIVENVVQHLARCVLADHMLQVAKTKLLRNYPPALSVHDELVYVVPEAMAEDALATIQEIMRTPVGWWPELITWSEGDIGDTYGDAK